MAKSFNSEANKKEVSVSHILERKIEDFSIKGNTEVYEIVGVDLTKYAFFDYSKTWTMERNVLTYTPKVGDSTANVDFLRFNSSSGIVTQNSTYTFCYRVLEVNEDLVKITMNKKGTGSMVLPVSVGTHKVEFQTGTNSDVWFLCSNLKKGVTDPNLVAIKIEILYLTEGSNMSAKCLPNASIVSTGDASGIQIICQTDNPKLGDYRIQGDISYDLSDIEDRIENNQETYDINWI